MNTGVAATGSTGIQAGGAPLASSNEGNFLGSFGKWIDHKLSLIDDNFFKTKPYEILNPTYEKIRDLAVLGKGLFKKLEEVPGLKSEGAEALPEGLKTFFEGAEHAEVVSSALSLLNLPVEVYNNMKAWWIAAHVRDHKSDHCISAALGTMTVVQKCLAVPAKVASTTALAVSLAGAEPITTAAMTALKEVVKTYLGPIGVALSAFSLGKSIHDLTATQRFGRELDDESSKAFLKAYLAGPGANLTSAEKAKINEAISPPEPVTLSEKTRAVFSVPGRKERAELLAKLREDLKTDPALPGLETARLLGRLEYLKNLDPKTVGVHFQYSGDQLIKVLNEVEATYNKKKECENNGTPLLLGEKSADEYLKSSLNNLDLKRGHLMHMQKWSIVTSTVSLVAAVIFTTITALALTSGVGSLVCVSISALVGLSVFAISIAKSLEQARESKVFGAAMTAADSTPLEGQKNFAIVRKYDQTLKDQKVILKNDILALPPAEAAAKQLILDEVENELKALDAYIQEREDAEKKLNKLKEQLALAKVSEPRAAAAAAAVAVAVAASAGAPPLPPPPGSAPVVGWKGESVADLESKILKATKELGHIEKRAARCADAINNKYEGEGDAKALSALADLKIAIQANMRNYLTKLNDEKVKLLEQLNLCALAKDVTYTGPKAAKEEAVLTLELADLNEKLDAIKKSDKESLKALLADLQKDPNIVASKQAEIDFIQKLLAS